MKIETLRSLKRTFIRLRMHVIFGWMEGFLSQLLWMTRLSKWVDQNKEISGNDFPSEWNYEKRYTLYQNIFAAQKLDQPITYLEFGVADGDSFRWWMKNNTNADSTFHGFDTFTGLPEDFGQYKKGTFNTGTNIPQIPDQRGKFHQGLFQQTLPEFLRGFDNSKRLVLMLDADLYSATLFVLTSLSPFLKKGDIIFFDEFGVPTHEFMAYQSFIDISYSNLGLIGVANNYYFTAFIVL